MTVSPSAYFTCGNFSNDTKSYSTSFYLTLAHHPRYLFVAYDNYLESDFHENLFALGYTQPIIPKLRFRSVGFYYTTSTDDIGGIVSNRIFYGDNPVLSLGHSYAVYSKHIQNIRKFYNVHEVNPEYQYTFSNLITVSLGFYYTNTEGEGYYAGTAKLGMNLLEKLRIETGLIYGELFNHIDDRLLVVNNRPNLQRSSLSLRVKYNSLFKNINIAGGVVRNVFTTYRVNYYTLGLEFERR